MIENYLKTFYEYIFGNTAVSNLFVSITICIIAVSIIKSCVGGVKKWYKKYMNF